MSGNTPQVEELTREFLVQWDEKPVFSQGEHPKHYKNKGGKEFSTFFENFPVLGGGGVDKIIKKIILLHIYLKGGDLTGSKNFTFNSR